MMNLLLIEDDVAEARLLQEALKGAIRRLQIVHVKRLEEAIESLESDDYYDVALLDLALPDSQGLASLDSLVQSAPSLPIVVLTNTNDDKVALEAVQHGAQDYLLKYQVKQDFLVRALRYAIERKQSAEALREANEILEHRVQTRTIELEQTNQLLQQEIEERQRIQERLELAQQAGKIGTFEWHLQSKKITWSKELEALYGLSPGAFTGQYDDWVQWIHSEDRSRVEEELQQSLLLDQGLNTEFRIVDPNDDIRWIAAKGNIFDTQDRPRCMIGVHIDITDKKQFEAQFLRAQRLESLGTLASGIAHDLNNILTPILAVGQLLPLKFPNLDEQTQQLLKMLRDSGHRGADLVQQILVFARGAEGKRMGLSIQPLLVEVEKMLQQTLPKSIDIQENISPHLSIVSADATQLHQVFMNLCVNARDAMPRGGTLTITAENFSVDEPYAQSIPEARVGPYVLVTISDTGIGIPDDILHRIFDPFFTTKELGKGTGLGLSAVLGIIKSHGGFIDVQSQVGQGCQFKVFLPATQSIKPPMEDELSLLSGQQELILVVDDEASIRDITKSHSGNLQLSGLNSQ